MIPPVGVEGLSLFDAVRRPPPAPSVPTPTSEAAARAAETTGSAQRQRDRILAYLRSRPDGATQGEMARDLGMSGDSVRPRCAELGPGYGDTPGLGLIRQTTETRRIPGHRSALVWRIAEEGR